MKKKQLYNLYLHKINLHLQEIRAILIFLRHKEENWGHKFLGVI